MSEPLHKTSAPSPHLYSLVGQRSRRSNRCWFYNKSQWQIAITQNIERLSFCYILKILYLTTLLNHGLCNVFCSFLCFFFVWFAMFVSLFGISSHLFFLNFKHILMNKRHLTQNPPLLREIFKNPPLFSYRKLKGGLWKMYLLEQSSEVFGFPILTNKSRVWPVYRILKVVLA